MDMKRLAILLALLSAPAFAQDGRDSNRESDRRYEHERWRHYEVRPAPRVGDPDPYAPKVGAPNPYAPRVGDANPYATRAGDPPKPLPESTQRPERRDRRR